MGGGREGGRLSFTVAEERRRRIERERYRATVWWKSDAVLQAHCLKLQPKCSSSHDNDRTAHLHAEICIIARQRAAVGLLLGLQGLLTDKLIPTGV